MHSFRWLLSDVSVFYAPSNPRQKPIIFPSIIMNRLLYDFLEQIANISKSSWYNLIVNRLLRSVPSLYIQPMVDCWMWIIMYCLLLYKPIQSLSQSTIPPPQLIHTPASIEYGTIPFYIIEWRLLYNSYWLLKVDCYVVVAINNISQFLSLSSSIKFGHSSAYIIVLYTTVGCQHRKYIVRPYVRATVVSFSIKLQYNRRKKVCNNNCN